MGTRATTVKHRTAYSVSPGQNYREPKLDENHTRTMPQLPPGDPRHAGIERNVAPRTTITALTAGHCGRRPHGFQSNHARPCRHRLAAQRRGHLPLRHAGGSQGAENALCPHRTRHAAQPRGLPGLAAPLKKTPVFSCLRLAPVCSLLGNAKMADNKIS